LRERGARRGELPGAKGRARAGPRRRARERARSGPQPGARREGARPGFARPAKADARGALPRARRREPTRPRPGWPVIARVLRLVVFEWRKLFARRFTWIALAILILAAAVSPLVGQVLLKAEQLQRQGAGGDSNVPS